MAFDVGAVVAKLRLDKKEWDQSISSVRQDEKKLSDLASNVGLKMTDLGKKMAGAGAVIVGSLGTIIAKTANMGDAINDMSKRTGIATETLSGYKLAAEKSGTSLDGLATGMRGLANQMDGASRGGKEQQQIFKDLGISYTDNEGRLRPLNDVMLDVADKFAGLDDGARKTALANDIFGRSGMELIPMLNLGAEGLRAEREEAERLGTVFSGRAAQACDDFNDSLASLKGAVAGAGKEIGMSLLPMAKSFIDSATASISKIREWAAAHPGLTSAISQTGLAIGGVATAVGSFLMIAGTLITKLNQVAAAANMARGALLLQTGALSALILTTGFYIAKQLELAAAEDYAAEAGRRSEEVENRLVDSLSKAAVAADWQFGRMSKLIEAYHGNVAALAMAIQKGKEGKDIQEALAKVGSEENAVIEEQRKKLGLLAGGLQDANDKGKEFRDWLTGLVPDMDLWAGRLSKVDELYAAGKLTQAQYNAALETISKNIKEAGGEINRVLPPGRTFNDLIKQTAITLEDEAFGFESAEAAARYWARALDVGTDKVIAAQMELANLHFALMGMGQVFPTMGAGMTLFADTAKEKTRETQGFFDGLWNNIAQGFGNTMTEWIRGATTFKEFMDGLWKDILQGFTQWIGQKLTQKMVDFFDGLFSKAKETGEGISNTVQTLTGGAAEVSKAATGAISGVWTAAGAAIGSFLGTTLASVFGGGPSGHQQQQGINDTKDSRNFLADIKNWLFSAGSGFGSAVWEFAQKFTNEKFDETKGFIATAGDNISRRLDEANGWLRGIYDSFDDITSAASGHISTKTELVAVHGSTARPEYIVPSGMEVAGAGGGAREVNMPINIDVRIDGQIITNREHVRDMIVPELIEAMRSGIRKAELVSVLGLS